MRRTALFAIISYLTIIYGFSQTVELDSLKKLLGSADTDTTRISLLIEIAKNHDLSEEGLDVAIEAYKLSQKNSFEEIKARAEAALGVYLVEFEVDSGAILIDRAIDRYTSLDLNKKVADVNWNLSIVFQNKNNLDSAVYYLNQSLTVASSNDYELGVADANTALASINSIRGENGQALRNCLLAKEIYDKLGEREKLGNIYNQMGIIYDYMGMYPDALENYLNAREIMVEIKDVSSETLIINNLGVMYDNMNNPEMALKYYTEALEHVGIFEYKEDEATILNNLSLIYLGQKDTTRALQSLWRAISITKDMDMPCFDIYPLEGLGSLYINQGNIDSAEYYLNDVLKKGTECEDVGILTAVNKGLGLLYQLKGQNRKALKALDKSLAIAQEAGLSNDAKLAMLALADFHKKRGNLRKSIDYLEAHQKLSDSIYEANNVEKATQLAAEYEYMKQVEEIRTEQLANQIAFNKELESKKRENQFILVGLILIALLAVTLGRSYYFIQKQNKKLKWLNEEKNTLMGVVAHDLRNPLNMIKGLMQMIVGVKTNNDTENSDQYLHLIKMSTQKMSDMIDKVLDISAVENMKVNLNMEKVNLVDLLKQTSANFKHIAEKKQIQIQNEFDVGSKHISNLDANYFDQVMDNLMSNAIKFSDSGTNIYVDVKTEEGHQIVSIKDEGPGLSEDEKDAIFKRFATMTAKPTSNEKSTGLGLSIVKKFVTAMNGDIFLESELGKGTTFYLKFKEA